MINIRLQTSLLLAILMFQISCNKHYNSKKIQTINQLEKVIESDVSHLNSLNMHNIHSVLKIASFNLSKIEDGKMDSIEFEIIYNDYKAYINCINLIYENLLKIDHLHSMVEKNKNQLQKIKNDYMLSKAKRNDLDQYLIEEFKIIHQSSKHINHTINTIRKEKDAFFQLNTKMEKIIY